MSNLWDNIFASSIVLLVMIMLMIIILGVLNFRGTAKKRKYFEDLHKRLKSGQKVVTNSGIYGTIVKVSDDTVDMSIKSGAIMTVSRFIISEIILD